MARILLIEPDSALAKVYLQALRQAGYETQRAASAQEAIYCADEVLPDVVVLEVQLAAHSGVEFLYEFRSYPEWRHIPVIINSYTPPQDFTAVMSILTAQLGVRALHYKPQTSLQLLLRSVAEQIPEGSHT